jgi:flavin reductase (DIM6/NTAB) family NADH-FMN oxidoreductase RutF
VDTRITTEYPGGDHAIFVGQVEAMGYGGHTLLLAGISSELTTLSHHASAANRVSDDEDRLVASGEPSPLLYYRGQYRRLPDYAQLTEPQLATMPVQRDT